MKNKIILDNISLNIEIKRKKIKSINIRIKDENTIYISCSYKTKLIDLELLLNKNKDWIIKNIQELKSNQINKEKFLFLGKELDFSIEVSPKDEITLLNNLILIKCKNNNKDYIDALIKNWYLKKAKIILIEEINRISRIIGLYPTKILIGNQKTLWGSCNSKKEIRLNWRLILMPYEIREYVMIHEICHIKEMNHSKNFWNLVKVYDYNFSENKEWLKVNGKKIIKIY